MLFVLTIDERENGFHVYFYTQYVLLITTVYTHRDTSVSILVI